MKVNFRALSRIYHLDKHNPEATWMANEESVDTPIGALMIISNEINACNKN